MESNNVLSNLNKLNTIPAFAKRNYQGNNNYSMKFLVKNSEEAMSGIMKLKMKHPELIYHVAKTGNIIFGGVFNNKCTFYEDVFRLILRS